jgi:hypothetical protein
MKVRLIGGALALVSFLIGKFTIDGHSGVVLPLLWPALFSIGIYMAVFSPQTFSSAFDNFSREKVGWGRYLGAILTLAVSFVVTMGIFSSQQSAAKFEDLKRDGIVTQGVVSEGYESRRRRGGKSWTLKVTFKDQAGVEHVESSNVSELRYNMATIGMPVDVIYNPKDISEIDVLFTPYERAQYGK